MEAHQVAFIRMTAFETMITSTDTLQTTWDSEIVLEGLTFVHKVQKCIILSLLRTCSLCSPQAKFMNKLRMQAR